jgi:hypothetical protein
LQGALENPDAFDAAGAKWNPAEVPGIPDTVKKSLACEASLGPRVLHFGDGISAWNRVYPVKRRSARVSN